MARNGRYHTVTLIIMVAFVARAYANGLASNDNANVLNDNLLHRALRRIDSTDLDMVTLAKAHSGYPHAASKSTLPTIPSPALAMAYGYMRHVIPYSPTSNNALIGRKQIVRPMAESDVSPAASLTKKKVDVSLDETLKPIEVELKYSLGNQILQFQTGLPLGIVMEENKQGQIEVVEVDKEGQGYVNGLRVGDILRATSCVASQKPSEMTLFSGVGMNTLKRKALVQVDGLPFTKVMDEIRSNTDVEPTKVTFVVERPAEAKAATSEVGASDEGA